MQNQNQSPNNDLLVKLAQSLAKIKLEWINTLVKNSEVRLTRTSSNAELSERWTLSDSYKEKVLDEWEKLFFDKGIPDTILEDSRNLIADIQSYSLSLED